MSIEAARNAASYVGAPPDDPKPFDVEELAGMAAKGALNDVELTGVSWQTFPTDLARYALDVMIGDLLVLGHRNTRVQTLAQWLGILDEDGDWT